MARFVVDLGDVEIPKEKEIAISHAIQKAALAEIADLNFRGPFYGHFPREWLGFILRKDLPSILEGEKEIGAVVFR